MAPKLPVACLLAAVASLAAAPSALASDPLAPRTRQTVTLLIPRASFEGRYAPSVATSLTARIEHAGGGVAVGGQTGWRTLGFPSGLEARVTRVKADKRRRTAEVELRFGAHQSPVTLHFGGVGKDELAGAFGEVAMEGPPSGAAVQRVLAATRARLADALFERSLAETTPEVRRSLVDRLDQILQSRWAAFATIQGRLTLAVDLGECDTTFNSGLVEPAARAYRAADERVLPAIRVLGRSLPEIPGIESVKLVARISSRDFANETATLSSDVLELLVPAPVAVRYSAGEMTEGMLLQESLTLLNAVPTPLSAGAP